MQVEEFVARHQGVDGGILEGDADALADLTGLADHVVTGHDGTAVGRAQQGREHPDGRGLPGSVRSEEPEDLT